ncbi:MAG: NAD-dependent epimerase/dehydratase family protein [Halobacteriovoraceae bacterium]|nr:NAD-dependent epimerase/dehydratase family protein [Halobacteriovoraceae bacterium]MCB9095441.1 NAD-dependent epimerase/dehydratase family protein [Halobacteriovoraceae bacterium]
MSTKKEKILIIGIGGGLARITCKLLYKINPNIEIVGIDSRPVDHTIEIPNLKTYRIQYRRGEFENLFRTHQFTKVLFLSRVTHSSISSNLIKKRLNLSLMGTQTILELCLKHNIERLVILSTFHVYGALNDNPVFVYEDAPLRASLAHPEIRDVVEMDQKCQSWMYEFKDQINTVILRPTNIIGPSLQNGITTYLTHPLSFYPLDFNPMIQFIHEYDMAKVLVRSLEDIPLGLYNISANEYLPLKEAVKKINPHAYPLPIFPLEKINQVLNKTFIGVPNYLMDYLKFPCLLANRKFLKIVGPDFFHFNTRESLETLGIRRFHALSL